MDWAPSSERILLLGLKLRLVGQVFGFAYLWGSKVYSFLEIRYLYLSFIKFGFTPKSFILRGGGGGKVLPNKGKNDSLLRRFKLKKLGMKYLQFYHVVD